MNEKLKNALLDAAETVLGLPQDEMAENMDLNLFENELIDSLGCMSMMNYVEELLHISINIENMAPEDLISLRTMHDALVGLMQ